jgi:hypothetical protein
MRREIVRSQIRFGLDDAADALDSAVDVDEVFAQQIFRDFDRVPVVEVPRQLAAHLREVLNVIE